MKAVSGLRFVLGVGLILIAPPSWADIDPASGFSCRQLFRGLTPASRGWLPAGEVRGPDAPRFRRIDHPVARSVLEIDALQLRDRLQESKLRQQELLKEKKSGVRPPLNISKLDFPDHYLLRDGEKYRVVEVKPDGGAGQLNAFMNQGPYGAKDLWASNAHRLARRFQSLKFDPSRLPKGLDGAIADVDRLARRELGPHTLIRQWEQAGVTNDGATAIQLLQISKKPEVIDAIRDFYAQEANSNPPVLYEHVARGIDAADINSQLADPRDRLMPWRLNAPEGMSARIANNRLFVTDKATGETTGTPIAHNPTAYARWDLWQSAVDARDRLLAPDFATGGRTPRPRGISNKTGKVGNLLGSLGQ